MLRNTLRQKQRTNELVTQHRKYHVAYTYVNLICDETDLLVTKKLSVSYVIKRPHIATDDACTYIFVPIINQCHASDVLLCIFRSISFDEKFRQLLSSTNNQKSNRLSLARVMPFNGSLLCSPCAEYQNLLRTKYRNLSRVFLFFNTFISLTSACFSNRDLIRLKNIIVSTNICIDNACITSISMIT